MKNNSRNEKDNEKTQDEEDQTPELKRAIHEMRNEFRNQLRELKEELGEIKEDYRIHSPKPPRPPRPPRIKKWQYKCEDHSSEDSDAEELENWGEYFGSTIENYVGGLLDSIGDTIDRSVGSIFHTRPSRHIRRRKQRKEPFFVPEEELEEFFNTGSKIMGALSDNTRLRMLKELEKEPLRQSDLSERTNTKGGNFKHHITILKDEGLVRQEGVRERYMLTFTGREALKLVEFLYTRSKKRIPIPIYSDDEEKTKEEDE